MTESDTVQQGLAAALAGKPLNACPYVFNEDARWYAWMKGWHSARRGELEQSWAITKRHLAAAKQELPVQLPKFEDGWSPERYDEWFSHNELELAFDELEGIGAQVECSRRFWEELLAAAENMGLTEHAARCRHWLG